MPVEFGLTFSSVSTEFSINSTNLLLHLHLQPPSNDIPGLAAVGLPVPVSRSPSVPPLLPRALLPRPVLLVHPSPAVAASHG